MPPPTQLAIAASSVSRLLKEQASYHRELADQEAEVAKQEESIKKGGSDDDGNAEFMLKQSVRLSGLAPDFFLQKKHAWLAEWRGLTRGMHRKLPLSKQRPCLRR